LLQRGIVLADPIGDAAAEDLVVADGTADKAVSLAVRLGQEARLPGGGEYQRPVKTAGLQVRISLVLILVRHDIHARIRPMRLGEIFLDRTLQHADVLALQRRRSRFKPATR